jgi:hypothetical protein
MKVNRWRAEAVELCRLRAPLVVGRLVRHLDLIVENIAARGA